jgi:hypothetical protein
MRHVPILTLYKGTREPASSYYEAGCTCKPWYGGDHRDPAKAMEDWEVHAGLRERPIGGHPGVWAEPSPR